MNHFMIVTRSWNNAAGRQCLAVIHTILKGIFVCESNGLMRRLDVHITAIIILICASAVLDTSITGIATSTGGLSASAFDVAFFAYMVVLFGYSQYVVLHYVSKKNQEFQDRPFFYKIKLNMMGRLVAFIQYILIAILALTLLQIILFQSYQLIFLKSVIFISFISSGIVLALLAFRLTSWLRVNRNMVVLLYSLAIATLAVNSFLTFTYLNIELGRTFISELVRPIRSFTAGFSSPDVILKPIYVGISILSFILTWAATVFLLRNYSSKLGKIRYWVLVIIPLAYFLSQFQSAFLYTFAEFRTSEPVLFGIIYNVIFSAAKPVGALLFGLAFWSVSKSVHNTTVQNYMMISAYGVTLLFTANQPLGLIYAPYPPFGLVTICFMVLASYLFYLGIYSASISVSEDTKLRQSIRKAATKESAKFLDSIGTAEMVEDIERRVVALTAANKDNIERETGISSSFDEEDIKDYLQEAIQEIKRVQK